jgi:hypothetical protein
MAETTFFQKASFFCYAITASWSVDEILFSFQNAYFTEMLHFFVNNVGKTVVVSQKFCYNAAIILGILKQL